MDLEEIARRFFREKLPDNEIIYRLNAYGIDEDFAAALLREIRNSEELPGLRKDLRELINFQPTGLEAGASGMGSRGEGDFIIHHSIARVAGGREAVVGPEGQDDGGVIKLPDGEFLVVSVDGLHSRLGHFPFLAGFHVARACLRDVLVMGAEPVALFSDVHLADNGDPAVILDYTAGISAVGEAVGIPLVAGSTLRIGGDLVKGNRLSGAAGAVGIARHLTPRSGAEAGDVLVMSGGSGGGTIASAAIFYGMAGVVEETLNLKFIKFIRELLHSSIVGRIHAMTDVTNGGIRGDAHEIARNTGLDIIIRKEEFLSLINPRVLNMLHSLNIDPLGVSIDSLLIICPEGVAGEILNFIADHGAEGKIIGHVEQGKGRVFLETGSRREEIVPGYREAPYTPVKAVVDKESMNPAIVRERMREAVERALRKKAMMLKRLEG